MERCREWTIEVDQDKNNRNLKAQEDFIIKFIGSLYDAIDTSDPILKEIKSLHYTRIFHPQRDNMGAYIRLRIFSYDDDLTNIEKEIDNRLDDCVRNKTVFEILKKDIDWEKATLGYGKGELAPIFRDYLNAISKISYQLLSTKHTTGYKIDEVLWSWTHFFFNANRGYSREIIELEQGSITGHYPDI